MGRPRLAVGEPTVGMTFSLPYNEWRRLKRLAFEQGVSAAKVVREALGPTLAQVPEPDEDDEQIEIPLDGAL